MTRIGSRGCVDRLSMMKKAVSRMAAAANQASVLGSVQCALSSYPAGAALVKP